MKFGCNITTVYFFPDCDEAVTWVLGPTRLLIDMDTMMYFRMLEDEDGNPIQGNFRETQDLGDRTIYQVTQG